MAKKPSSKLEDITPYLREADMYKQWSLNPIRAFVRLPDGRNSPISPSALRLGDFVKVGVKADIQSMRRNGAYGSSLTFIIVHITRLLSAAEANVSHIFCTLCFVI